MHKNKSLLPLRRLLWFTAMFWGVNVLGLFMGWNLIQRSIEGFGGRALPYDPMMDYWLRMTAGVFSLLGCWYLVLMIRPHKYYAAIPWFGGLMVAEGLILLVHGLRLGLPPFPFYADTGLCLLDGGAIVYLSRSARTEAGGG